MRTVTVYLIGKSGTGKYTIAKEIAKSGYVVCDNQLINNPIFALLNCNGFKAIPEYAWEAIDKIRTVVLDFIAAETDGNYVLTNELLDNEEDRCLYNAVKKAAQKKNALFVPVKLHISTEENARRVAYPERAARYKSLSLGTNHAQSLLPVEHSNLLELEVTKMNPSEAARIIIDFVKTLNNTQECL